MALDGAEDPRVWQTELPRTLGGEDQETLGARAGHHAVEETQRFGDRPRFEIFGQGERLAQERVRKGLGVAPLGDAELAEVLAPRAVRAHVVVGEEREARVRPARSVRINRIARELAEARDGVPEGIDVIGVPREAGDDRGVAGLHCARGAPQRDHAARAAHRDVIQPARRQPEMLHQADRGVGEEQETRDGDAVDVLLA